MYSLSLYCYRGHTNDLAELLGCLQMDGGKIAGCGCAVPQCPFLKCVCACVCVCVCEKVRDSSRVCKTTEH